MNYEGCLRVSDKGSGIGDVGYLAVQKLIEQQMIKNYSKDKQRLSSPNIGNTYVVGSLLW